MEPELGRVRSLLANVDADSNAAVRTGRLDSAVDLQRGANAERVPGAVRVPLALSRPNSIARWDSGERIGHADFEAVWLKDQGVRIMQAAPTTGDVDGPQPGDVSDLIDGRRSPEFDE